MADVVFKVMVSSNFTELQQERAAVRDAIQGQRMLPLMMETVTHLAGPDFMVEIEAVVVVNS